MPMEALMRTTSKVLLIVSAVLLGACSDGSVAPSAPAASPTIDGNGATANLTMLDTIRFTLSINAEKPSFIFLGAGNWLTIPAHAVCDPTTSTYGPTEWDKPCDVARNTVAVKAKAWLDKDMHPHVDFEQHLRFVPSANPAQWVMITFTDYSASFTPGSQILYCASPTSSCVDESKSDPTMATVKDPVTGHVVRRIKHFSGYNVFSGRCDATDPSCSSDSSGSMSRGTAAPLKIGMAKPAAASRQGYMLAWA
jgi:hypothetical protein